MTTTPDTPAPPAETPTRPLDTSARPPETPAPPARPRMPTWMRVAYFVGGGGLLVLGILGLILPVLPGWIFVIPGVALLSAVTPKVRQFLRGVRNRVPRRWGPIRRFFHRLQAMAKRKKK